MEKLAVTKDETTKKVKLNLDYITRKCYMSRKQICDSTARFIPGSGWLKWQHDVDGIPVIVRLSQKNLLQVALPPEVEVEKKRVGIILERALYDVLFEIKQFVHSPYTQLNEKELEGEGLGYDDVAHFLYDRRSSDRGLDERGVNEWKFEGHPIRWSGKRIYIGTSVEKVKKDLITAIKKYKQAKERVEEYKLSYKFTEKNVPALVEGLKEYTKKSDIVKSRQVKVSGDLKSGELSICFPLKKKANTALNKKLGILYCAEHMGFRLTKVTKKKWGIAYAGRPLCGEDKYNKAKCDCPSEFTHLCSGLTKIIKRFSNL